MLGLGPAIDHDPPAHVPAASSDQSFRVGTTFRATDRWRPGGFLELHALDLEIFDAAVGPQVQMRIGEQLAVQLRAGVGLGDDGGHALAGISFGTYLIGASVNARRFFDTKDVVVSINIEVMALVPAALAIAFGQ
jgi:hypothetical protein